MTKAVRLTAGFHSEQGLDGPLVRLECSSCSHQHVIFFSGITHYSFKNKIQHPNRTSVEPGLIYLMELETASSLLCPSAYLHNWMFSPLLLVESFHPAPFTAIRLSAIKLSAIKVVTYGLPLRTYSHFL